MYSQVAEHTQSHAVNLDWIADEWKALGEFELTIFCNFLSVLCPQGDQRQFYFLFPILYFFCLITWKGHVSKLFRPKVLVDQVEM